MIKKCKSCGEVKLLSEFSKSHQNKDGHASDCKPCKVIYVREYHRTAEGRITYIYNNQKKSSTTRNHPFPEYTKKELFDWAMLRGLSTLIQAWKQEGYSKDLAPSIDRLDPNKPYCLDNIRLVTWKDNNAKAYEDRKACNHITSQNKKVRQLTLDGAFVAEYGSIANAARTTGITRININDVCRGKPHCKTAGGFIWEYIK